MKSLVTGCAGFIGSHLVDLLIEQGHEVVGIDSLLSGQLQNLDQAQSASAFSFHKVDLSKKSDWIDLFEGVDWVFHLAGQADIVPSIEQPESYYENNVTATLNVLQAARRADVNRLIYAASSSCYGIPDQTPTAETAIVQPQYPYALTKWMGESLVLHWSKVYGLHTASLRLFNVYGPRSRTSGAYGAVFGVFLAQKRNKKPFTIVGDGTQSRDFTFVTDVCRAFLAAAEKAPRGEIFNVGSGGHYSVNYLTELLQGEKVHIPKRPGEPDITFADIQKIEKILKWKAQVSFEQGVQIMLNHLDMWKSAPVWDPKSIEASTQAWFKHLGDSQ